MYIIKLTIKIGVNKAPKDMPEPRMINTIPRYMGFLDILNGPDVTKYDALSGLIGLIVVCTFLNSFAA